ncbi:hypothetical protein M0R04_05410 [Candidatus Dojkabacteria bacterium]|jgi:hypothetical protein|nr:hypothetical protein [Candidatus Dojkabacteria bacterium]
MIISEKIIVKISNQGAYYKSLGYEDIKQGQELEIYTKHLLPNSQKKVDCLCDVCGSSFKRQYQLVYNKEIIYCYKCSRLHVGKKMNRTNINKATKERCGINHPRWNPNKEDFKIYAYNVRRLTEKIYKDNIDIINPFLLQRAICGKENGYQLDHIKSIKFGFDNDISPKEISDISNLQIISWEENRSKWA